MSSRGNHRANEFLIQKFDQFPLKLKSHFVKSSISFFQKFDLKIDRYLKMTNSCRCNIITFLFSNVDISRIYNTKENQYLSKWIARQRFCGMEPPPPPLSSSPLAPDAQIFPGPSRPPGLHSIIQTNQPKEQTSSQSDRKMRLMR